MTPEDNSIPKIVLEVLSGCYDPFKLEALNEWFRVTMSSRSTEDGSALMQRLYVSPEAMEFTTQCAEQL